MNGTISSITEETAIKMFVGQAADKAFLQGAVTSGLSGDAYDYFSAEGAAHTPSTAPGQMPGTGEGLWPSTAK